MSEWKPMRVNIKHALEMEAKTYRYPPHTTMIQEIIANAQDAFKKHNTPDPTISIELKRINHGSYILFHNNAKPISKEFFKEKYHTLFESSKNIGESIGFVGIGAKIFLSSHDEAEIITITGDREILASKWKWTDTGPQHITSLRNPISKIVDLKKFPHTGGTTFICKLAPFQYSELHGNLKDTVHFWWNYALLSEMFAISVNGEKIKPKIPGTEKKNHTPWIKGGRVNMVFHVSKNELDDDYQNIVYTVHGKRIENEKLDTALSIKNNFGSRIFCYVDATILARHVIKSKEGFARNSYVSNIRTKIRAKFWDFVKEEGLYKDVAKSITNNVELNQLANKLNAALQSSEFKDLNPFLVTRHKAIVPSRSGEEPVSEVEGSLRIRAENSGVGGGGSVTTVGEDPGKAGALDRRGSKSGDMRNRRTRGISISEIEHEETERMEAYVSEKDNAVIINTGHPFYKRIEGRTTAEFYKYKIVVEALVRYKADAENWDTGTAFNKARDILHSIYD